MLYKGRMFSELSSTSFTAKLLNLRVCILVHFKTAFCGKSTRTERTCPRFLSGVHNFCVLAQVRIVGKLFTAKRAQEIAPFRVRSHVTLEEVLLLEAFVAEYAEM